MEVTTLGPTMLHCDNQGTILMMKDASYHMHFKHIDGAHHLVHEQVEMKEITFTYLPSHSMPVDALLKSLGGPKQTLFCKMMGIQKTDHVTSYD